MKESIRRMTDNAVVEAKAIWYGRRGEPIQYGAHRLRYVPGTRPPRMKYLQTGDMTTRNELRQIEFLLRNVEQGDTVLDVGAHAGQYAVLLGSLVGPRGRVLSFEPDEIARVMLRRNIALNKFGDRVTVESIALSDRNGSHSFFSLGGNSMSSLTRGGLGNASESPAVTESVVRTMRLDDFLVHNGTVPPQWIKIDTEGAEILILRGATGAMASARGILCELHPYAWSELGTTFDELVGLVKDAGRNMCYLDPTLDVAKGPVYGTVVIT